MKTVAFLLLLALVFKGSQAQCGAKLNEAAKCIGDFIKSKADDMPKPPDPEKLKADVKKCFVDSGCKPLPEGGSGDMPPEALKRIAGMLQQLGVTGIDMDKLGALAEATKKCAMAHKDDAKQRMGMCMRSKNKLRDFTFPELFDKIGEEGDDNPLKFVKLLKGHKGMEKKAKMLVRATMGDEFCDTDQKKDAVQSCIEGVVDANTPEKLKCMNPVKMMFGLSKIHREFCKEHAVCVAKVGDCKAVHDQLPREVCDCADRYLKNNFDSVLDKLKGCIEQETGSQLNIPKNVVNRALKKFAQKMISKVCLKEGREMINPCDGPPSFLEHGPGSGEGGRPPFELPSRIGNNGPLPGGGPFAGGGPFSGRRPFSGNQGRRVRGGNRNN